MEDDNIVLTERTTRERSDIVRPIRLQAFSDAVFATAATLLVVPLRKFELENETLADALVKRWSQMAVFVVGFLVICAVWESHIIRFRVVSKVDDVVVFFTLLSLMVTTFLPFAVALVEHFGKYEVSIILNCMLLLALEIIELIIFVYGFRNPKLLSERFKQLEPQEMKVKKRQILFKAAINSILFILAAVLSFASYIVSWLLVCVVIIAPLLRRVMVRLTYKFTDHHDNNAPTSSYEVLTGRISKERIELFSDAATAIVATLLILDLTTEEFPKTSEVIEKGSLEKVLAGMWQQFVSYLGTYGVVGFLWFVHHSILQHIKIFTSLMVVFNSIFLAFLAGSPFISTLVNKYTGHISHNEQIAVRVSSFILFMASFMQLCIYLAALLQRNTTFYSWAIPHQNIRLTTSSDRYLLLKALIIPVVTLVTFFSSFATERVTYYFYHIALFAVPVAFVVLKIVYACHCWQQVNQADNVSTSSRRSSISESSVSVVTNVDVRLESTANNGANTAPQM